MHFVIQTDYNKKYLTIVVMKTYKNGSHIVVTETSPAVKIHFEESQE